MIIRIRHPEAGYTRRLVVTDASVELVEIQDAYLQYEFIMPYHSVRITIVDEPE